MRISFIASALAAVAFGGPLLVADEGRAPKPAEVRNKEGVKLYLVDVVKKIRLSSANLRDAATEYRQLCTKHGGAAGAAKAEPAKVADLIRRMRDAYQGIDSFGFEYVEGIVAGVPSLAHFDVELDSGTPKIGADASPETVANVVIKAGDLVIDHEGSLNNFLIEPTVFGTNARFVEGQATLPGFDKPVGLPKPELVVALSDYAVDGYQRLEKEATAWTPTEKDCFEVLVSMTPTLADYFDEWKESKNAGGAAGGRFVAVSRLSDMRGIMSSTQLTWKSVEPNVSGKDAQLASQISRGYQQILSFIDDVESREKVRPLTPEAIDALGTQAKERADKLTVQATQASTLVGLEVGSR